MQHEFSDTEQHCFGVLRWSDAVRARVRADTDSSRGRFHSSKGGGWGGGTVSNLVQAATVSWSPLEVTGYWCRVTPLEVSPRSYLWTPLEVGALYKTGCTSFQTGRGFGYGTAGLNGNDKVGVSFGTVGLFSTVRHFENIARTASMDASCKSHRLSGTSFSEAVKKWMMCVMRSSGVIIGFVRYSWRNSTVSVMSNCFVFLSMAWKQR